MFAETMWNYVILSQYYLSQRYKVYRQTPCEVDTFNARCSALIAAAAEFDGNLLTIFKFIA